MTKGRFYPAFLFALILEGVTRLFHSSGKFFSSGQGLQDTDPGTDALVI
jgi:hypothetical protein